MLQMEPGINEQKCKQWNFNLVKGQDGGDHGNGYVSFGPYSICLILYSCNFTKTVDFQEPLW